MKIDGNVNAIQDANDSYAGSKPGFASEFRSTVESTKHSKRLQEVNSEKIVGFVA